MSLDLLPIISTASALGAGAVSAPALTRLIWPKPKTTFLRERILWNGIEADGRTVTMLGRRGGGLFRVIHCHGEIYSGMTTDELVNRFNIRKGMFDGIAERPVSMRFISRRSHLAVTPPPSTEGLAQHIDSLWHQRHAKSYITTHHIILSVPTQADRKKLDEAERLMLDQLHKYNPRTLEVGNPEKEDVSPLLSWLATHINGMPLLVAPAFDRLGDRLAYANISFERSGLITQADGDDKQFCAAIGIKAFPEKSTADIINGLLQIPAPIEIVLRALPYTKEAADPVIAHRAKQAKLAFYNRLISQEWEEVQEKVNASKEAFFKAELTVYATEKTTAALSQTVDQIRTSLANHAARVVRETQLAERLWWSRLPGYEYFSRDYHILSSNLADFTPLKAEPTGRTSCQWGPYPVRYFTTVSGAPYGFVFHQSASNDLAHALIIGPSAGGKSTLINFLQTGALSAYPDLRCLTFDRMLGCFTTVQCYGGDYLIPEAENLPLNPFLVEDSPEHREFLRLWLQMLTQLSDDDSIQQITNAIDDMMSASAEHRIMSKQLSRMFEAGPLRKALAKWCGTGKYGRLFNGERDALDLRGSRFVAVDMTEMHSDPQLSAAMAFYILHRFRQMVVKNPMPHLIFIDEAPAMLRDQFFREQTEVLFREHRKLKGAVIMASQDPGPFNSDVFLNNTAVRIFLRNPSAQEKDYRNHNLTPDEWDYIKGRDQSSERLRYSALVKREGESIILNTDLSALGGNVRAFSSSIDDRITLKKLKESHGAQWLKEFLPLPL